MPVYEARDHGHYWPTSAWLERYRDALNDNESLTEKGAGWGVDWNGDFVFEIRDVPVQERTIGDLPEDIWGVLEVAMEQLDEETLATVVDTAPDEVRADIEAREGPLHERAIAELRETPLVDAPDRLWPEFERLLPDIHRKLLDDLEENVTDDGTVYAFVGLEDGRCTGVDVLDAADERAHGMRLHGPYGGWTELMTGDLSIVQAIMSGKLDLDGDMNRVLQYTDASIEMTETAAALDKEFLF